MKMNVKQIVEKWLIKNGHDGLCRDGCGCGIDDLMPCSYDQSFCVPAKRIMITKENVNDYSYYGADVGMEWFVPSDEYVKSAEERTDSAGVRS